MIIRNEVEFISLLNDAAKSQINDLKRELAEKEKKEKELFSRKEAAKYLNVTVYTLKNWARFKKNLTVIKVGHKSIYRKEDLDKYLNQQTIYPKNL